MTVYERLVNTAHHTDIIVVLTIRHFRGRIIIEEAKKGDGLLFKELVYRL